MPSQLLQDQWKFARLLPRLLDEVERRGWRCTIGDVWAVDFNPTIEILESAIKSQKDHYWTVKLFGIVEYLTAHKHSRNSRHYDKCAIDLNLFKPEYFYSKGASRTIKKVMKWHYCTLTSDHAELGAYWKSLDPLCTWGGDFEEPDGGHYSIREFGKVRPGRPVTT